MVNGVTDTTERPKTSWKTVEDRYQNLIARIEALAPISLPDNADVRASIKAGILAGYDELLGENTIDPSREDLDDLYEKKYADLKAAIEAGIKSGKGYSWADNQTEAVAKENPDYSKKISEKAEAYVTRQKANLQLPDNQSQELARNMQRGFMIGASLFHDFLKTKPPATT